MSDRIAELERLERLRASGTLSEAEFAAEKAGILAAERGAQDAAPAPVTPPPVPRWLWYGIAAIFVAAIVTVALVLVRPFGDGQPGNGSAIADAAGNASTANANASVAVAGPGALPLPAPSPTAAVFGLPQREQLSLAFAAAFGKAHQLVTEQDGTTAVTKPEKLLDTPYGPVLITSRTLKDGCHGCAGALGVHYLKAVGDHFVVVKSWPDAVPGSSWGVPPEEWNVSDAFGDKPVIYATGGGTWQGYSCSSFQLVELTDAGPKSMVQVPLSYSDEGAIVDQTKPTSLEGSLANIVKNGSFEVRYKGSRSFTDRYIRKGDKFVPAGSVKMKEC